MPRQKVDHAAKAKAREARIEAEKRDALASVLTVLCGARRPLRTTTITKLSSVGEEKVRNALTKLCDDGLAARTGHTTGITPAGHAYARKHGLDTEKGAGKVADGTYRQRKPHLLPDVSYPESRAAQLLGQGFNPGEVARMVGLPIEKVAGMKATTTKPSAAPRSTDPPRRVRGAAPAPTIGDYTRSGAESGW